MHVPDVLPGGELLVVSHQLPVRAVRVMIEGPRVHTVPITSRHVTFAGVPAGNYTITPLYEGGLKGEAKTATVRIAETSLVFLPAEDVGAVRITAVSDVCGNATEMDIDALAAPRVRSRVITSDQPKCDVTIGGLKPGRYQARFRRQLSGLGSREFATTAQQVAHVDIAGPPVIVEGRVTLNGKPLDDVPVSFQWRGDRTVSAPLASEVKTTAGGYYSVPLEVPGRYAVTSRPMNPLDAVKEVEFSEGRHIHDIAIVGAKLTIRLLNRDPKAGVAIDLRGAAGTSRAVVYGAGARSEIVLDVLPWGSYKVSVRAGSGLIREVLSNAQSVTLTASNPEATLTFDLSNR
jgi:hypothetical protein